MRCEENDLLETICSYQHGAGLSKTVVPREKVPKSSLLKICISNEFERREGPIRVHTEYDYRRRCCYHPLG